MIAFSAWLTGTVLDGAPTVEQCVAHAESWLYNHRIEPISEAVIKRAIYSAMHRYEQTLQSKISSSLSASSQASFDALLLIENNENPTIDEKSSQLRLHQLSAIFREQKCNIFRRQMPY